MTFLLSMLRRLFRAKPKRNYRLEQWQKNVRQKDLRDAECKE